MCSLENAERDLVKEVMEHLKKIIDSECCIGCGACHAVDAEIKISFNEYGMYEADIEGASLEHEATVLEVSVL
jgi:ferredoxin